MSSKRSRQDERYDEAIATYGAAIERLVRGYEADPDMRRDLLQDIHLSLWRSLEAYEGRCSLRTWIYRVAHCTANSYVLRQRRGKLQKLMSLEEVDATADHSDYGRDAEERMALDRLLQLIHRLKPIDRDVMLLYLEGTEAAVIAEITGLTPGNVRSQIHRIKSILSRRFHEGGRREL